MNNKKAIFESMLKMTQPQLKKYLEHELKGMGYSVQTKKGFLYAPGDVPVLLTAHLDTVHKHQPQIICYSDDGRYVMSPTGIGGDDRAGVYMIMQIIQSVRCHVLFCEDEETGGHGAKAFAKCEIRPDLRFIVGLDRHGDNDAVFYDCDNPDFTEFVCSFDFQTERGSFSDISIIAPKLKTAAVNISAGYHCEHRPNEYIDLAAVENNILRTAQMVSADVEHFPYMERRTSFGQTSLFGRRGVFSLNELSENDITRKFLMPLPTNTRLVVNGCEIEPSSRYLMDRNGLVYVYLEEINAAVEAESTYACDTDGELPSFFVSKAMHVQILSYEHAIEQLELSIN